MDFLRSRRPTDRPSPLDRLSEVEVAPGKVKLLGIGLCHAAGLQFAFMLLNCQPF